MNRREEIELLRGRHEIFDGISGKGIMLVSADPPGRTDTESYIAVPIEHPDAGIIHIHEWQHIFFKTRLHAREKFVDRYVDRIARTRGRLDRRSVIDFVTLVANGLDDLRVNSLWATVWPGDAAKVADRWRRLASQSDSRNFVMHLMGAGLGLECLSPWTEFDDLFKEATRRVERQGYLAVLTTTRWLLDELLDVLDELRPQEDEAPSVSSPSGAVQRLTRRRKRLTSDERITQGGRLLDRMLFQAQRARSLLLDTHLPVSPDPDEPATDQLIQAALGILATGELDEMLSESKRVVNTVVSTLRTRMKPDDPNRALTRELGAVRLHLLERHDVEELVLSREDERVVDALHSRFMQLMDMRQRKRSESGGALDPQLYIDMMLGSGENEIFMNDSKAKGFSAIIMPDMSGSMFKRWLTVSRACKVCAKAMKFPFSNLEVWGFSGSKSGETVMFRFLDVERGYFPVTHQPDAWGLTPLHIAIPVATRRLRQMPGSVQHLFIVTDGDPQHIGPMAGNTLRESVARATEEARRSGINVAVILVGNTLSDDAAAKMFGSRWTRIDDSQEDFFYELVDLVGAAFTSYLRK